MKLKIYKQDFIVNGKATICITETASLYDFFESEGLDVNFEIRKKIEQHFHVLYYANLTFKGVAKCSDKDEFVELMGVDIAENKAHLQMNHFLKQVLQYVRDLMIGELRKINDGLYKYQGLSERCKEVLDKCMSNDAQEHYKKIEENRKCRKTQTT